MSFQWDFCEEQGIVHRNLKRVNAAEALRYRFGKDMRGFMAICM